MKKSLLIALAVTLAVSVTAQQKNLTNSRKNTDLGRKQELVKQAEQEQSTFSAVPRALLNNRRVASGAGNTILTNSATVVTLDSAASYRSQNIANRNTVWYDSDVNAITFVHRANVSGITITSPNWSSIRYAISKNGGTTWNREVSAYTSDTNFYVTYPQAVIGNPTLGTDPNQAYLVYNGLMYDSAYYGGYLRGEGYGQVKLDTMTHEYHADNTHPYINYIEDIFTVKVTGEIWKVGEMLDTAGLTFGYSDSIIISHGVWNTGTLRYDYTHKTFFVPNDTATFGGLLDINIAFDDFGQIGYIAMINANVNNHGAYPDSSLYLSVLKTIDYGATWSFSNANSSCDVGLGHGRPDIINISSIVDTLLGQFHDPANTWYNLGSQLDLVVDGNSDCHILTPIFVTQGGYTYNFGDSLWGMFDIYSNNNAGSVEWKAKKLAQPVTYYGRFGDGSTANPTSTQYSRPFACRSSDGYSLFFNWFDTDTVLYGVPANGYANISPDLWSVAYNVGTHLWSAPMNLTHNTDADGACTFASGAYYAIDSANQGTAFSMPVVYMELNATAHTGEPVAFKYLKNANMHMTDATHAGDSVSVPCANIVASVPQVAKANGFTVSANYPNPFSGKTSFDINLVKASDVSVEVTNLLGSVISMNKYTNLGSGFHTLSIDGNKLSPGVYFYTVKAGNEIVTKKMSIQ